MWTNQREDTTPRRRRKARRPVLRQRSKWKVSRVQKVGGRPGQFMPWLVQIQKSNSVHLWKPSPQNQSVELIRGKFVQCFTGVIFSFFCLFFLFVWFQFENKMPQTLHTYIIYIYIDIYIAINIYHRDFQLKIIRWWEKVTEPLNSGHIRPESRVWIQFETTLLEAFLLI